MLQVNCLTITGKEFKADTKSFLDNILLSLLNTLKNKKLNTKDVELFGTNDIYVFRGTNIVIFSFSRSKTVLQPVYVEHLLSEVIADEKNITINNPCYFTQRNWNNHMVTAIGLVSPVSIAFPLSYLSLKDKDLTEAYNKVAELLVKPSEEDIDKKNRIVRVNPIYGGRDFIIDSKLCFVLMEFKDPYLDIYDTLIKPTVEEEGFQCLKSDDIFSTTSVIEDIWANINKASLIIAEISSNNPNVMYELGVCHTVGKNVMMITQQPDNIPFNFRHLRCYPYTNDIPGSKELKNNIKSIIQHIKTIQH